MNYFKSTLRFYLGLICSHRPIKKLLHSFFKQTTITFLKALSNKNIQAAYLRRSILTSDFYPFWSDVDLTIVVRLETHQDYLLVDRFFSRVRFLLPWIVDIEVIDQRYFNTWKIYGGFRKWAAHKWLVVWGEEIADNLIPKNPFQFAFDVAWDYRILYPQLFKHVMKIKSQDYTLLDFVGLRKSLADLTMLSEVLHGRNHEIHFLTRPSYLRGKFSSRFWNYDSNFIDTLGMTEEILRFIITMHESIMAKIEELLGEFLLEFDAAPFYDVRLAEPQELFIQFFSKHTFVCKNLRKEYLEFSPNLDCIIIDLPTLRLFKAIGFQEQNHIYDFYVKERLMDFPRYLEQRFVQDYQQAVFEGGSGERIYFCQLNIWNFFSRIRGHVPFEVPRLSNINSRADSFVKALEWINFLKVTKIYN